MIYNSSSSADLPDATNRYAGRPANVLAPFTIPKRFRTNSNVSADASPMIGARGSRISRSFPNASFITIVLDTVEVVDLSSENSTCKDAPNYPLKTAWAVGGLYNNTTPIICGGTSGNETYEDCFKLQGNSWISIQPMTVPREAASATKYPSAVAKSSNDLLVIGGYNSEVGILRSLEAFGPDGWKSVNSSLPEGVRWGCAMTVNETTVVLTGHRCTQVKVQGTSCSCISKIKVGDPVPHYRAFHILCIYSFYCFYK